MTKSSADQVAVVVDRETCIGIGACVAAEPLAFELGDDGVSRVVPGSLLPRERAERVCLGCPSGALSIANSA
jgi:ferredoxin